MKASEFIKELQSLIEQHGDLEVLMTNYDSIGDLRLDSVCVECRELSLKDFKRYDVVEDGITPSTAEKHFSVY